MATEGITFRGGSSGPIGQNAAVVDAGTFDNLVVTDPGLLDIVFDGQAQPLGLGVDYGLSTPIGLATTSAVIILSTDGASGKDILLSAAKSDGSLPGGRITLVAENGPIVLATDPAAGSMYFSTGHLDMTTGATAGNRITMTSSTLNVNLATTMNVTASGLLFDVGAATFTIDDTNGMAMSSGNAVFVLNAGGLGVASLTADDVEIASSTTRPVLITGGLRVVGDFDVQGLVNVLDSSMVQLGANITLNNTDQATTTDAGYFSGRRVVDAYPAATSSILNVNGTVATNDQGTPVVLTLTGTVSEAAVIGNYAQITGTSSGFSYASTILVDDYDSASNTLTTSSLIDHSIQGVTIAFASAGTPLFVGSYFDEAADQMRIMYASSVSGANIVTTGYADLQAAAATFSTLNVAAGFTTDTLVAITGAFSGAMTAASLGASGAMTAATLTITGAGTITGNLTLSAMLSVSGATTLSSTVHIIGAATFDDTVDINTGLLSTRDIDVTGSMTASGKVQAATLNITGDGTISGNATVGGTLFVTGEATTGALNATTGAFSGAMTAASLGASGAITGATLNISGLSTFSSLMQSTNINNSAGMTTDMLYVGGVGTVSALAATNATISNLTVTTYSGPFPSPTVQSIILDNTATDSALTTFRVNTTDKLAYINASGVSAATGSTLYIYLDSGDAIAIDKTVKLVQMSTTAGYIVAVRSQDNFLDAAGKLYVPGDTNGTAELRYETQGQALQLNWTPADTNSGLSVGQWDFGFTGTRIFGV